MRWCVERQWRQRCARWCEERFGCVPEAVHRLRCVAVRGPVSMAHLLELGGTPQNPAWPEVAHYALSDLPELQLPFPSFYAQHGVHASAAAAAFVEHWRQAQQPPPEPDLFTKQDRRLPVRLPAPKGTLLFLASGDWRGHGAHWRAAVEAVIAAGADPGGERDELHRTPLHYAAGRALGCADHERVVRLLTTQRTLRAKDKDGATPLHFAAISGDAGTVAVLVASGAEPSAADNSGLTPLHRSVQSDAAADAAHVAAVVGSLATPRSVAAASHRGWTALHSAAAGGHARAVAALLSFGASPLAEDVNGLTPAKLARCQLASAPVCQGSASQCSGPVAVLQVLRSAAPD
eukprot:TRINITY_DN25949_c0_g1_i1.p1 TRINITY_DN25949_c0_g1~~TRINITY_DN25949_c0_g1_i1.p1  ORF type:complete len:399 (+),score=62.62 TRINITY_DN25949_c0_g1_i1:154-1197(+)